MERKTAQTKAMTSTSLCIYIKLNSRKMWREKYGKSQPADMPSENGDVAIGHKKA